MREKGTNSVLFAFQLILGEIMSLLRAQDLELAWSLAEVHGKAARSYVACIMQPMPCDKMRKAAVLNSLSGGGKLSSLFVYRGLYHSSV